MTEAVGAIMQWGFGAFDELDRVVTSAISANVGSRRVLEKCGFEFVGLVVEKWESLDALNAHLVAPHMGSYREQVKDLVTGMNLQVLQPA